MVRVVIHPTSVTTVTQQNQEVRVAYDVVAIDADAGVRNVLARDASAHLPLPPELQLRLDELLYEVGMYMGSMVGLVDAEESVLEKAAHDGQPLKKDVPPEEGL